MGIGNGSGSIVVENVLCVKQDKNVMNLDRLCVSFWGESGHVAT